MVCLNKQQSNSELLDMIKTVVMTPAILEQCKTYCTVLEREMLHETEHFKKKESHFLADGTRNVFHCNIDDRDYEVIIKPMRRKE